MSRHRVMESILSLGAGQVLRYLMALVTIPYLFRVIGTDHYGQIAFAQAINQYFLALMDYGFSLNGTKQVAAQRENGQKLHAVIGEIWATKVILALLGFLILLPLVIWIPRLAELQVLILLTYGLITSNLFMPTWIFQGLEKMRYIPLLTAFSRMIYLCLLLVMVRSEADFLLVPVCNLLAWTGVGLLALVILYRELGFRPFLPAPCRVVHQLRSGFSIFVGQTAPILYKNTSTVIVGFFFADTTVALFDLAMRVLDIFAVPLFVVARAFLPKLATVPSRLAFQQFLKVMILCALGTTVVLLLGSPFIMQTFTGEPSDPAVAYARVLALSLIFMALNLSLGTNYLVIKGENKLFGSISLFSSLFYIGLVFSLAAALGIWGVVVGVVAARAFMSMVFFYYYRRLECS